MDYQVPSEVTRQHLFLRTKDRSDSLHLDPNPHPVAGGELVKAADRGLVQDQALCRLPQPARGNADPLSAVALPLGFGVTLPFFAPGL